MSLKNEEKGGDTVFLLGKQQLHQVTLKLSVAALLTLFSYPPKPASAAILRVATDPMNASSVGVGYGGLSEADGLALLLGAGAGKPARGGSVLFAWEAPTASGGNRSSVPLSPESLVNSLGQLRLDGNGNQNGGTFQVPILNQVGYANIYEGVYIFTPKDSPKTNSRAKSADNRDKSATTTKNKASGPLSVVSWTQPVGLSLASLPGGGLLQSGLLLYPHKELSSIPTNLTGNLNNFPQALEQLGAPSINVQFPLQPKTVVVNSPKDYPLPSNLQGAGIGNTLGVAMQIQQQVQQQAQKNAQEYQQQQVLLQKEIQQQIQEQQQQQEQAQREAQQRLQEQEIQLREQYRQQQQEIQERLQQQLQEQEQRLQEQLAQQQQAFP